MLEIEAYFNDRLDDGEVGKALVTRGELTIT